MNNAHRILSIVRASLLTAAVLTAAACTSASEPTATAPPDDSPGTPTGAPTGEFWRTDLPLGGIENQVANATPVLLADGTTQTLEALAGGKPLLLYFYATW